MQANDVFFYLTAADNRNKGSSVIKLPRNSRWFCEPRGGVEEQPTISSREPTPAPDTPHEDAHETKFLDATERLAITFSELRRVSEDDAIHPPPADAGVVFGTDPRSCHVILGYRGTVGISAKQFVIRTDSEYRPVLIDIGSTYGTAVETNGQNKDQKRRRHQWVLSGPPGSPEPFKDINIWLGDLALKIVFPNHHQATAGYVQKLHDFAIIWNTTGHHSNADTFALRSLDLASRVTTEAPSGAHTPTSTPVYYREKRIGRGAFGQVHRVIKMSDGLCYAAKTFARPANKRERDSSDPSWLANIQREFSIVNEKPHPNVVKVFAFHDAPEPVIFMEYFEGGNIADAGALDEITYMSATGQILEGLEYLHGKGIAHRDLKPENFLIVWQPFFRVAISDFGLAKTVPDSALLSTFCGSLTYIAPEVFPYAHGHNYLADIWSLGVIILQWIYNIPDPPKLPRGLPWNHIKPTFWRTWVDKWSRDLHGRLDDQEDCLLLRILSQMLEIRVEVRWNASQCLQHGFDGKLFRRREADQLVVCADDPADIRHDENSPGAATPKASSPGTGNESGNPTVIIDRLWT